MSAHQDECESRLKSVQHSQYQNNPVFGKATRYGQGFPIDTFP